MNTIPKSVGYGFTTPEDFANFISRREQYYKDKEIAISSGVSRIIPMSDKKQIASEVIGNSYIEYFYLVTEFENIENIDYERMIVHHVLDYETRLSRKNYLDKVFRSLYYI